MSELEEVLAGAADAHRYATFGYCSCGGFDVDTGTDWDDMNVMPYTDQHRAHVVSAQADAVREWLNSDEVVALIEMTLARRHKCLEHNGPNSGPCRTDRERTALVLAALTRLADGGVG